MGKIFWVDTETTGLEPHQNAVIQIAGIIDIDGKPVEKVNCFLRPHRSAVIVEAALNVNGRSREEIAQFPPAVEALRQLKAAMSRYVDKFDPADKFVLAGYNVQFDIGFLRSAFTITGDKYFGSWFFNAPIDVMTSVGEAIASNALRLKNYKLTTVCEYYGIPNNSAHDAQADIEATRALYYYLKSKA